MGFRVGTINPGDPPDAFPDPAAAGIALGYPDGLIAIGGDLSPPRLLAAYRRGIFPWYNDDQPILWWSPDPRAVIAPERFHMSRSLRKAIRRQNWSYSVNQCFARVIAGCADERGEHGTWITPEMSAAFTELHALGYAHSVESWCDGALAGGLYGVRLGRVFFAESMFSLQTNGSKVALSALISMAPGEHLDLIDCQLESPHLSTLGMHTMPRSDFLTLLAKLTTHCRPEPAWQCAPVSAKELATLRPPATC